jgi:hypothetical protein
MLDTANSDITTRWNCLYLPKHSSLSSVVYSGTLWIGFECDKTAKNKLISYKFSHWKIILTFSGEIVKIGLYSSRAKLKRKLEQNHSKFSRF